MGWRVRCTLGAVFVCTGLACSAPASAQSPSITLKASSTTARSGSQVTLTGQTTAIAPATEIILFQSAYPYTSETQAATASTDDGGAFTFTVSPVLDTRYRAVISGTSMDAEVQIAVTDTVVVHVKALPLGRAAIRVLVYHPSGLPWAGRRVRWSFATGSRFHGAPSTLTRRLGADLIALHTTVTLPAGRFRWRACFNAEDDQGLVDNQRPPGCSGRGYDGWGWLPYGYPGPRAIRRAADYLASRTGRTAFAVMDSEGRLSGVHVHWTFVSASVVKAMLLVAYLRRLDAMGQRYVDASSNSFLYPMINVSDNNAATQTWSIVGDSGLYEVAHAAGMTDFSIVGIWADAQISAADQAKFFFEMDKLIPREFVGYARNLLSTIAGYESWGIPAIARPRGYQVFFKGGWRGTGLGQLVHQIGRLEGHGKVFSVAVMTDGDPSMGYGIDTIQGVTAALLQLPPPRHVGRLVPRALAGGG
jgi:hypothetical protein